MRVSGRRISIPARSTGRDVALGLGVAFGLLLAVWLLRGSSPPPPAGNAHLPAPISKASPTPTARPCTGVPLTSQAQVQPDTAYCGGRATSQITLAAGDIWTNGEVTGVATSRQEGAVNCASHCTLVNVNVHDNPRAFAGIYTSGKVVTDLVVEGGRVTGSGSLGIGGGHVDRLLVSGVEIDHNGATADCGFEGGGLKAARGRHLRITGNYVHDNNCVGIWLDVNTTAVEVDHNRIIGNTHEGVFFEISHGARIHDNTVAGNGFMTNGTNCSWLWGGGITVASSFDVEVNSNTLTGNCNGITGTQQDRTDGTPPEHLLGQLSVHDNRIAGPGLTGVAADNGADLARRSIIFSNNSVAGSAVLCGLTCP